MMIVRKLILGFAAAALSAGLVATAGLAQDEQENPAVAAREGLMNLLAFNLSTIGAMAQEKAPYDAAAAQTAADNIALLAKLNGAAMWPAGTDNASIEGTRALPALWDNMADAGAKFAALGVAADAMAAAAGTDLASLQAAMEPLGGACGGCHKAYRASE